MFIIMAKYIRPIEEIDQALSKHYEFIPTKYLPGFENFIK